MKKIKHIELLPMLIISFFVYRLLTEQFFLTNLLHYTMKMLAPFFWALAIAYVVNIAMENIEKKFHLKRGLSLTIALVLVIAVLALFFVFVIPMLVSTVPDLLSDSTSYYKNFMKWYNSSIATEIDALSKETGVDIDGAITGKMQEILKFITGLLQRFVSALGSIIYSITTGLIEFFIGLVMAIYVLSDKEDFFAKTRKLFTAYFGEKFTNKAADVLKDTDIIFGNYLVAKSLDSFIVALIALVGFKLIGLQYWFLFAIIIGVTNMIPYFGPIIGAVPVLVITLFISPMQALWAAIFVFGLQQLDGNVIGPKIVDERVGLPALWGVVSVSVGGTLFGFMGMLLGTPVFAVLRKIVLDIQDKKLEEKGLLDKFADVVDDGKEDVKK